MKPEELDIKVERTQCGGFVFRFEGEAPYYAQDHTDLIDQLDEQIDERFESGTFDEPDDFEDELNDDDFGGQGTLVKLEPEPVEVRDLTDFGAAASALKGIYAMRDPRPAIGADGDATELGSQLQEKGIGSIINLTEKDYTEEQKETLSSFGIEVHSFPVKDFTVPKIEDVNAIVKLTRDKEQKFAIHCTAGKGRTGTVVSCIYVARDSMITPGKVLDMVRQIRPGSVETEAQAKFVNDYAAYVDDLKKPLSKPQEEVNKQEEPKQLGEESGSIEGS